MQNRSIKVFAPATVSNVGPGFDLLGFALHEPGDEVVLKTNDTGKVKITKITGDKGLLPYEVEKNTASVSVMSMLQSLNLDIGLELEIHKKMGLGSGLGSSAASAVAAVYALNQLLDNPYEKRELLKYALDGEQIASQDIHADNTAPCLYGGFTLIRSYNPLDIINIPYPESIYCTIIYPQIEIKTSEARKLLGKEVTIKKSVEQMGNFGGLLAGMMQSDLDLIKRSLKDIIVEPVRATLIPGYYDIKNAALDSGALGCSISGSGPAIFTLSGSFECAKIIGESMQDAAAKTNLESIIYISQINKEGPRVL
jgi:homoserine kinase